MAGSTIVHRNRKHPNTNLPENRHPKFVPFNHTRIIECHAHLHGIWKGNFEKNLEGLFAIEEKAGIEQTYVLDEGHTPLYLKARYPGRFYAGAYIPWTGDTQKIPKPDWPGYLREMTEAGYDGIAEMGSKPVLNSRRVPLTAPYFRDFWETVQERKVPLLLHVADPEEFWTPKLAPAWARKRKWTYNRFYPTKEELYKEAETVLDKYPGLKVTLCHFYFMSADLDRTAALLNRYPNVNLDLALGVELMYNLSRQRDRAREFFIRYQDRILFGTDIMNLRSVKQMILRAWMIRNFLESEEEFFTPPGAEMFLTRYKEPYVGLKLPSVVLRKIYAENFQREWGKTPRKVNVQKTIGLCEKSKQRKLAQRLLEL